MGPRRPENGPTQDSTGVCTGTQPLCRPQPLDPEPTNHLTICLPQGPNTECEAPGPGGGPGSGPGAARPEPTTSWSVRAPPCPRQRRARQPPCFQQRWARLPQGRGRSSRRSDPGAVDETQADHGAGQRGDSRPGGEDGGAAGRSDHGIGQPDSADHGAGRRELPSQSARKEQPWRSRPRL